MPEKWASGGYWYGCDVFVHVLLMITVYSAGAVGRTGFAAAGGAAGGAVFELLPHATSGSRAIASTDGRRARMTVPSAGDAARLVQKAGGRHSSQGLAREHSARSCRSFTLASSTVCHCMLLGASAPPAHSGTMWSTT